MADDEKKKPGPHLAVVIFSGTFEKVHYALVLASSALAIGRPVTLFFTMGACGALTEDWRSLPASSGSSAGAVDDGYVAKGIGSFEDLRSACQELGAKIMVCEMGLKAIGMSSDLLDDSIRISSGGAVTFLTETPDAQTLFI